MPPAAPHENLLLLNLPRTGSAYLAHLLRQNRHVAFHYEYLGPHSKRETQLMSGPPGWLLLRPFTGFVLHRAKLRDLAQLLTTSSGERIVGASLDPFAEGLSGKDLGRIVNASTRVIVLTRENLLKQHISLLNLRVETAAGAARPDRLYNGEGRIADRRFHIGPEAVGELERLERQREALLGMVRGLDAPQLFLTYESHLNVPDKRPLLQALADFLGLDLEESWGRELGPDADRSRYHKLISDDLREVIENYDELAADEALARFLQA